MIDYIEHQACQIGIAFITAGQFLPTPLVGRTLESPNGGCGCRCSSDEARGDSRCPLNRFEIRIASRNAKVPPTEFASFVQPSDVSCKRLTVDGCCPHTEGVGPKEVQNRLGWDISPNMHALGFFADRWRAQMPNQTTPCVQIFLKTAPVIGRKGDSVL